MENHTEMRLWREHFAKCVIEDHFPEVGRAIRAEGDISADTEKVLVRGINEFKKAGFING